MPLEIACIKGSRHPSNNIYTIRAFKIDQPVCKTKGEGSSRNQTSHLVNQPNFYFYFIAKATHFFEGKSAIWSQK